jgi:hypothetical protein
MSPLEVMAKARHDRLGRRKSVPWEKAHPEYRAEAMREAAADLIALAEARVPGAIVAAGLSADSERKSRNTGFAAAFQAMLRAVAEQGTASPVAVRKQAPARRAKV